MRRPRLAFVIVVAAIAVLTAPGAASAHPLGNFTINHFADDRARGERVFVRYALDLAEIPTFQEGAECGARATRPTRREAGADRRRHAASPLAVVSHRTAERPGAGGLKTMRFDAVYRAAATGTRLTFTDIAYASRIGWREIVVTARAAPPSARSTVPATSRSEELRAYPTSLLRSPLDVVRRRQLPPGRRRTPPPLDRCHRRCSRPRDGGFESLIQRGDLSLGVILLSLLIAAFWGCGHALTPGHGKALVAGYLVGTKGTPRDAFLLGGTVTVTHTAGVFALGLVTLLLSHSSCPSSCTRG